MARKTKTYRAVVGLTHGPTDTRIPAGEMVPVKLFTQKQIADFIEIGAVVEVA